MGKSIFRFNHPQEAAKLREQSGSNKSKNSTNNSYLNCSLSVKSRSMPTLLIKSDLVNQNLFLKE